MTTHEQDNPMTEVQPDSLVDGRYRIVSRIGSGGMADVFLAEDTQLGRRVALKMLHRRFAEDHQFVERFRLEASSAASMQHPNIVSVFDRGEHDGTYYIAMEHLEGRTLKQVIAEEAPLSQERSIDLAIQILAAAGFAHKRGVVHRDFKPQNVIVDDRDNLKVTDFGIARAGASEMTETGSILGTAQYLSPEQAQGHAVGAASDLYSIGVILFEMATGEIPFQADSAVAIAVQHLSQPPPPPSHIRPDINPSLEATILRALAKEPGERWQTADDFIAALQSTRAGMAMGDEGQGTAVWGPLPYDDYEEPRARRPLWPWVLGFLAAVAAAVAAFFALQSPVQVTVPDLEGRTLQTAQQALEAGGLEVKVQKAENPAPINEIVAQSPTAGTQVDEGSTVTLTASTGPAMAAVPDVRGLAQAKAIKAIQNAGFDFKIKEEYSPTIDAGMATDTFPLAGVNRALGSTIDIYVSRGPRTETVPSVTGLDRAQAENQLSDAGFRVSVTKIDSEEPEDTVVGQDPAAQSEVEEHETVALSVSNGRLQPESVPNVGGLDESRARGRLSGAGFDVKIRYRRTDDISEDGIVMSQDPSGGEPLKRGGIVHIEVGRFEAGNSER